MAPSVFGTYAYVLNTVAFGRRTLALVLGTAGVRLADHPGHVPVSTSFHEVYRLTFTRENKLMMRFGAADPREPVTGTPPGCAFGRRSEGE